MQRRLQMSISKKSVIVQNSLDTVEVGDVLVNGEGLEFKHSVHQRYSDFNNFERDFARS